jgi:hyperosmotically inducible periplasmic protein
MAATLDRIGWLPALMLGAAALAGSPPAVAQTTAGKPPEAGPRPQETAHLQEVVISAARDQAITAKVTQALQDDPYVYAGHISVQTENGVVTLSGIAFDLGDLERMLYLARKASGTRRIVNEVELLVDVECHD